MRWLALVFAVLILALQYPMWLGKGGWLQVRETPPLPNQSSAWTSASRRTSPRVTRRIEAKPGLRQRRL